MLFQTAFSFSGVIQRLAGRFSGLRLRAVCLFQAFWALALAQQAQAAIILQAFRCLGGAVLFRSSRPSSSWGFPFWPPGLTFHRSRPATPSAEFRALVVTWFTQEYP